MSLEDDILRIYARHLEEQDPRWRWTPAPTIEEDQAPDPSLEAQEETERPATPPARVQRHAA